MSQDAATQQRIRDQVSNMSQIDDMNGQESEGNLDDETPTQTQGTTGPEEQRSQGSGDKTSGGRGTEAESSVSQRGASEGGEEEEGEGTLDERDEELESLRRQIDELRGSIPAIPTSPEAEHKKEQKVEASKIELPGYSPQNFMEGLDLETVTGDSKAFNELLNRVAQVGYETGSRTAVEHSLRAMPEVIRTSVVQQLAIREAAKSFYDKNKDLSTYQRTVGSVAQRLISENPQMTVGELYSEKLASETRKVLGFVRKAGPPAGSQDKPKFAKPPTGRVSKKPPQLTGLEAEIAAMNKAIEKA